MGKKKATVKETYRAITIRDLMEMVAMDPKSFPKGLDTVITTGDFEGNYQHQLHEMMTDGGKSLFLGYEMHEGFAE